MLIIPFLLLLLFFGLELTIVLKVKMNLIERLSVSYLLGIGIFTFFVFLFDWIFNIDYSLNNTFSLLISLCIILFAVKRKDIGIFFKGIKFVWTKPKLITILFWAFILLVVTYTLIINLYWPISDWDALALYDFRARVFLVDNNLIHAIQSNNYFIGYPLFTSLGHLFVYQIGLSNPKFIYSLLYLSFIIIFFSSLRKMVAENKAIALTVILVLMPETFSHATMAYTNLPYTIYIVLGSIYLYLGLKNKDLSLFMVSSIFVGLSTWTRSVEPFWLSPLVIAVIFSISYRKWLWPFVYTVILAGFMLPWRFLQSMFSNIDANVASLVTTASGLVVQNLQPSILKPAFDFVMTNVIMTHLGYFILLILILVVKFWIKSKKWLFTLLLFFYLGLIFAGTIIFVRYTPQWQDIPDSLTRMVMFIFPIILFLLAEGINEFSDRYNK